MLAICAFVLDLESQAGTRADSLLAFCDAGRTSWSTEVNGITFMLAHELSDLVTGAVLVPLIIFYASRLWKAGVTSGEDCGGRVAALGPLHLAVSL